MRIKVSSLRWAGLAALVLMLIVAGLRAAHVGVGAAIKRQPVVRLVLAKITDLEVALDTEPPTPPAGLVASTAPVVQAMQSYINADHVTKHVMAPFG